MRNQFFSAAVVFALAATQTQGIFLNDQIMFAQTMSRSESTAHTNAEVRSKSLVDTLAEL